MSELEKDLSLLRKLHEHHTSLKCRDCKTSLLFGTMESHFEGWLSKAKGSSPAQISAILCKRCKKYTCIGCRKKPLLGNNTLSTPAAQVNNCCGQGRLFGTWLLLARFDEQEVKLRRKASKKKRVKPAQHQPGDGIGYNDDESDELCSTFSIEDHRGDSRVTTQILQILTAFLPSRESKATFDNQPPAELFAILRLGFLLSNVGALLRNDSVNDMNERSKLYHAMLKLVKKLARHEKLIGLLSAPLLSTKRSPGLEALATSKRPAAYFSSRSSSLSPSVAACTSEGYKHAKAFLDLASNAAIASDKRSQLDKDAAVLCEELVSFYRALERAAPDTIQSFKSGRDPWLAYSEANRVTFSDAILEEHMLKGQFIQIVESPRGRMAALRKEIASLTTSLPDGIFLKISETRPDVMKLLMIGVEGTPYEGGLFAFDVLLPQKWPEVPPSFYFAYYYGFDDPTTQPCTHINPNIHPDGLVCLSLLNTWAGDTSERWQPHKTTLLSVFISVQAFILGSPNPLLNLPGLEAEEKTAQLIKEKNDLVQVYSVAYAMIWWISGQVSFAKNGVWKDISAMYWKCKGPELMKKVAVWARNNERLTEYCEGSTRNCAKVVDIPTPPGYIDMGLVLKVNLGLDVGK